MKCGWCGSLLRGRRGSRFCGQRCRQSAFRLRRRRDPSLPPGAQAGARFAYADPPYPGLARKYYRDEPTYAGEVDHGKLIAELQAGGFEGWALSTSSAALQHVLALCPPGVRVFPWVKPIGVPAVTWGPHNAWEPLVVHGGRKLRPGFRDYLRAQPARRGGQLPGRKPLAFAAFLFQVLGMVPGDELVDLFPGTGIIGRAWEQVGREYGRDERRQLSLLDERQPPRVSR